MPGQAIPISGPTVKPLPSGQTVFEYVLSDGRTISVWSQTESEKVAGLLASRSPLPSEPTQNARGYWTWRDPDKPRRGSQGPSDEIVLLAALIRAATAAWEASDGTVRLTDWLEQGRPALVKLAKEYANGVRE